MNMNIKDIGKAYFVWEYDNKTMYAPIELMDVSLGIEDYLSNLHVSADINPERIKMLSSFVEKEWNITEEDLMNILLND